MILRKFSGLEIEDFFDLGFSRIMEIVIFEGLFSLVLKIFRNPTSLFNFRVGMLALESLGRQRETERPQVKFAKNPSYGDDVRWLMKISRQLGMKKL